MKDAPGRFDESLPVRRSQAPPVAPPQVDHVDDYQEFVPPPLGAKKVSLQLVMRAARRYWWQALLLWMVTSIGLMTLAYTRIKPSFDAISQIRVELDSNEIFGHADGNRDPSQFLQTQVALISTPTTIGAALAKRPELLSSPMLKGTSDPEIEVRNALRAGAVPRTMLIQVEMSSPVPGEAANLVNAVVDAYLAQAQQTYDTATEKRIKLLKETRDEEAVNLHKAREYLEKLTNELGDSAIASIKDKNVTSMNAYQRLSESLTAVQIDVIQSKAKLNQLRAGKEAPQQQPPDQVNVAINDLFSIQPEVVAIDTDIHKAQAKLKAAQRLNRGSDPSIIAPTNRIKELTASRDALWKKLEPRFRRQVMAAAVDNNDIDKQIKDAESVLNAQVVMQEELQARLDAANLVNRTAESEQVRLGFAKTDLQRRERVIDRIDDTLNQYRFNAKNPTARVELNHLATPSFRADSSRRWQVMGVAPVATGLLVLGLLLLMELRGARIGDPEELASRMHLQVIGVVPPLPQIRSSESPSLGGGIGPPATPSDFRAQRQLDEFVQSLDHLRVALCARRDPWGRDRHCVLITSACGSEGKTTLAAQLAERCVNAGLMTLLIDADLRNPTLSRMLDAVENPGLINVLRGEMTAEDVIMVVGDAGGFHLLPGGHASRRSQPSAPERAARQADRAGPRELRHDHCRRPAGPPRSRCPDDRPMDRRRRARRPVRYQPVPPGRARQPAAGAGRRAGDRCGRQRRPVDGDVLRRLLRLRLRHHDLW